MEGLIAIDAIVPRSLGLPTALVELGYGTPSEPLTQTVRAWLARVGESAAETIVEQIEKPGGVPTTTIHAKLPPAFFGTADPAAELTSESA